MGNSRWGADDWSTYVPSVASKPTAAIFTSRRIDPLLDPSIIKLRESVDSVANPKSTPIAIFSDVTGSMGRLAGDIIKEHINTIMTEIYGRKPVSDPHMMIGAIGDGECDDAPLQLTQFEAGVEPLTSQIAKIYIEGGGGGNSGESYMMPWWFMANKVRADAIIKRHRKGYIFTIGDEDVLPTLTREQISKFLGGTAQNDISTRDLLTLVSKNWEVFHIILKPVCNQPVVENWRSLLGQRALVVDDESKLSQVIVSAIQVNEGASRKSVIDSWDGTTSLTVAKAVGELSVVGTTADSVIRF